MRLPTLTSASIGGIALPVLLLYRFDDSLVPIWMPVAAIPYYLLLGCDLVRAGYRWQDLPAVYALNLLLIPVNLAGTVQSLRQAFTGHPVPFKRTPKVSGHTSAPVRYLAAVYALFAYLLGVAVWDEADGKYRHMLFDFFNAIGILYGIIVVIGVEATWKDVMASLRSSGALLRVVTPVHRIAPARVSGKAPVAPPYNLRMEGRMERRLEADRT